MTQTVVWRRRWKKPRRMVEASVAELGKGSQRRKVGGKLRQVVVLVGVVVMGICSLVGVDRLVISTLAWHEVSTELNAYHCRLKPRGCRRVVSQTLGLGRTG